MLRRMAALRILVCVCVVSVVVLSLLLFALLRSDDLAAAAIPPAAVDGDAERRRSTFLVDTDGCKIPNIDPFDPSIRHLVNAHNVSVVCNATPPMTYELTASSNRDHFVAIMPIRC